MTSGTSAVETVRAWLHERGVPFVFTPKDIPAAALGIDSDAVSAALFLLFKSGCTEREPMRTDSGRLSFIYTTTDKIAVPRRVKNYAKDITRNRKPGYKAGTHVAPPKEKTAEELADEALNAIAALQAMASRPLSSYTNAQLIAELHRRNGSDIAVQA